jgi:hypothetical protein
MFGGSAKRPAPQEQSSEEQSTVGQETIVAIDATHQLRSLSVPECDTERSDVQLEQRRFKIRLTRTAEQRESTNLLVRKMYSCRGYDTTGALAHGANRISLSVSSQDHIIGTLTLGLDMGDGLAADALYKRELDELRAQGRHVCEITKLAVDQSVGSRRVLAALFHIAFIHARRLHGCTDVVVEVNPCHVRFYERMLGFRVFGSERLCPRVNAPAVLLRLEFDYVEIQLNKFAGHAELALEEKSLYPYAFSRTEEAGIAQRLQQTGH